MGYRSLRLCSGGGGFEAIPDPGPPVDLAAVRATLERNGIRVVDARVMLIASLDPEVTISRSGRLLFKTGDEAAAARAFDHLRRLIELPSEPRRPRSGVRSR